MTQTYNSVEARPFRSQPRKRSRPIPHLRARTLVALALAASDVAAIGIAMLTANLLSMVLARQGLATHEAGAMTFAGAPLLGFSLVAYLRSAGRYQQRQSISVEIRQLLAGAAIALLFNACLEFSFKTSASRVVVCGTWLVFPVAATALRELTKATLRQVGLWRIRTLVVGTGELAQTTVEMLTAEHALGYRIVGQVDGSFMSSAASGDPWCGVMSRIRAEFVVIALDAEERPNPAMVEALVRDDVPFAVAPPLQGLPVVASGSSYAVSHDLLLLSYRNSLLEPAKRALKVTFDLLTAGLMLLVMSPLFIAITLVVRLDGGPALYRHMRVGLDGRRFGCLKFRSMVMDSEARLQALLDTNPAIQAEWQASQKLRSDPRVTRVGDWLRRTSLDELPQLLNVLRLEMSLVGPRPIVESEMVHYGQNINYYFEARPGITGLWQVSGRSDTSYAERVRLDTWYVKNWTVWHDITILARTVPAVLLRRGAM